MADASAFRTDFFPAAQPNALLGTANEAMNFANASQTNKLLNTENVTKQFELFEKQMGGLYNLYGGLLSKGPNLTANDVSAAGQYAVKAGLASPEQVEALMGLLPPNATPEQLRQFVADQASNSLAAHDRVATFYGLPSSVSTGGETVFGRNTPWGFKPSNSVDMTLTPAEKVQPVPAGVTAGGQPVTAPQIKVLGQLGVDEAGNPIPGANGAGMGGGPEMVPNPDGGIVSTLPTGTKEAQTASAELYAADRNAQTRYQTNAVPLMGAYKALVELGPQGTGIGKKVEAQVKNFLNAWGFPGADVEKLQSFEELSKYLQQNALSGNPGTDNQMAAMFSANPNTEQSWRAARALVASGIANQRYQAAQSREFAKTGLPENAYADFAANDFNVNNDRRAYMFDLLGKAEQQKFIDGLDEKTELPKFWNSLQKARELGLVSNSWTGD